MKIKKLFFLCALTFLILLYNGSLLCSAIEKEDETRIVYYTVMFDTNGAINNIPSQSIRSGGLVAEPNQPSRGPGYIFMGWYDESKHLWNFSTDRVYDHTILKVVWMDLIGNGDYNNKYGNLSHKDYSYLIGFKNYNSYLSQYDSTYDFTFSVDYMTYWGPEDTTPLADRIEEKNDVITTYLYNKKNRNNYQFYQQINIDNDEDNYPLEIRSNNVVNSDKDFYNYYFPQSAIDTGLAAANRPNIGGGGCGSLALIGMLDYFARVRGYTNIENYPNEYISQVQLAYDVYSRITVGIIPENSPNTSNTNNDLKEEANTRTYDIDDPVPVLGQNYVACFNDLIENEYYYDNIYCTYNSGLETNRENCLSLIIENINNGMPVTIFTCLAGDFYMSSHYVNVYGYEIFTNNVITNDYIIKTNILLKVRMDWSLRNNRVGYYVDPDVIFTSILDKGVITYTCVE